MSLPRPPKVSIGLPVYNGAATIEGAIAAITAQDFTDFELIVADNASDDGSGAACARWAGLDPRIRFVRHQENRGALRNFSFVLEQARGDYFMWAATDDRWSTDFVSANHDFLERHPAYVASISPARFAGGTPDPVAMGDGLLGGARFEDRAVDFLSAWHANSCFYSLFRRDVLLRALNPIAWYLAFDWTVMLRATHEGPMRRIDAGWIERGVDGMSSSAERLLASSRSKALHWIIPFYDMIRSIDPLLKDIDRPAHRAVLRSLARLNYHAARYQIEMKIRRSSGPPRQD